MGIVRRLRLIIAVFLIVIAGGGVYLWRIGGKILNRGVVPVAAPTAISQQWQGEPLPSNPPLAYRLQDISVAGSDDQTALANYGRAVAGIMAVYNDKETENELTLINKAAEKTDSQAVAKLIAAAARHATVAARLKALAVPLAARQIHLNLINGLIRLAETGYLMAQIEKNPVVALENAQIYPAQLKNFFTAINNLNFFLLASNVILPESERSVISLGL